MRRMNNFPLLGCSCESNAKLFGFWNMRMRIQTRNNNVGIEDFVFCSQLVNDTAFLVHNIDIVNEIYSTKSILESIWYDGIHICYNRDGCEYIHSLGGKKREENSLSKCLSKNNSEFPWFTKQSWQRKKRESIWFSLICKFIATTTSVAS